MRTPLPTLVLATLVAACTTSSTGTSPSTSPATAAPAAPAPVEASAPAAPDAATGAAPASDAPAIGSADAFSLTLLAKRGAHRGNLMVSGTSVRSALGIAYLGAKGTTADELRAALSLPATPDATATEAAAEAKTWDAARGGAELSVANRLWASDKGLVLDDGFVARAQRGFGGGVEKVPFVASPEGARKTINAWVSERTKTKIPELLPSGSLTPLTRLVITNAVYFKATWLRRFTKAETKDLPFEVDGATATPVPTMHQKAGLKAALDGGLKAVELPYANSTMAMLILLPESANGLPALEDKLTPELVAEQRARLLPQEISLFLPKATFKSGGSIKPELQALGIKAAFSDAADFTALAREPKDLYVTDVFHETFVAIDEEGTEAAAATGAVMATRGMSPMPPPELRVDHPFVFVIHDTKTGRILFAGRVNDPRKH